MRLPAVLSVCTKTAWSPSARAGLDTLAKAGVAAIAAAAAVVAAAIAAAAVTRIAVLTNAPQVRGSVFWPPSVPLEELALHGPGGRARLGGRQGGPAAGPVAAGRDTAGPREGTVERVLGGVAEGPGDGADGVVGVAEPYRGEVHAPAGQVGGRGAADLGGEAPGQGGTGDADRGGQGGDGPVAPGLGVQDGEGGPGDGVGQRSEPGGGAGLGWARGEPGTQQLDEQDVHDAVEYRGGARLRLADLAGEQAERGVQGRAGLACGDVQHVGEQGEQRHGDGRVLA